MKFFVFAFALTATSLALAEAAATGLRGGPATKGASVPTLPNGKSCSWCPSDDDYDYRFEYPSEEEGNQWHRALGTAGDEPNGKSCSWCPSDDDYDYRFETVDADRELTSTDKLKASAKNAHYEAHYLEFAASKQVKEEHKRALQDAAAQASEAASMLADAINAGDIDDHDRILKEKMLPNGKSCSWCPSDDDY